MTDELSARLGNLLDGTYDCVDRIVLNGYHSVCYSAGGFRLWWRSLMSGSEEQLDNAHLMRLAGRFSRRVRGFAKAHHIPVIDCRRGERKHDIAQDYLAEHSVGRGLFMILVGRAVAPVWDVQRSSGGGIHLTKKLPYINHYSFHIMDPQWGHITIKMAGHRVLKFTMTSRCKSGQRRYQDTFVAARRRSGRPGRRSAGSSPLREGATHQSAALSEACRVETLGPQGTNREPSLVTEGEGHGRGRDLGSAAPKNPAA
jgi:hypothetical protein